MGCACKGFQSLNGGFGAFGETADQINCPPGYQASADAQGNPICVDPTGKTVPATLTPGVPVETQDGSSQAAMGVLGWAAVIAGTLLVGSFVMRPKRG